MTETFTAYTPTENNQEERDRIDYEIRKLHNKIVELSTARNRLAPVAQLPLELLTKIFLLVRNENTPPCGLISLILTWICRDWRAAALNFSPLWNCVDLTNPSCVEAFLKRSRNAPLVIKPRGTKSIHLILETLPRIIVLDLEAQGESFVCGSDWDAPAPVLLQLALKNFILPDNILSGTHPLLRNLSLRECVANWHQLPIRPNLVDLHIIDPQSRTTVTNLIFLLQSLPKLQNLELSRVLLDEAWAGQSANSPRFPLESLKSLIMHDERTSSTIALFYKVGVPHGHISLHDLDPEGSDDIPETILSVQGSRIDPTWCISHLGISINADSVLQICIKDTDSQDTPPTLASTKISFFLPWLPEGDWLTQEHIMYICNSLQLATLQALQIHGELGCYEPAFWRQTLGTLPNLRLLSVSGKSATHFLKYLREEARFLVLAGKTATTQNPLGSSQNLLKFQALHTLIIGDLASDPPDYEDIVQLRRVLDFRKIYLERLPKLVLSMKAPLPDDVLASFSHVVSHLCQEVAPNPEQTIFNEQDGNNDGGDEV